MEAFRGMILLNVVLVGIAALVALQMTDNGLDYWLNRYQTLIGAFAAVGAAWYAGLLVKRQINAANTQIALAREQNEFAHGFGAPSFIVLLRSAKAGNQFLPDFLVKCENWNRQPLELVKIEIVEPEILRARPFAISREDPEKLYNSNFVLGTNPRSDMIASALFQLKFEDAAYPSELAGRSYIAVFEIEFLLGGLVEHKLRVPSPMVLGLKDQRQTH